MSQLEPANTTMGDICGAALKECGAIGVGQTPLAEDINDAWTRLQWMLMQWERKRWLVYHLVNLSKIATGAVSYTVGPGGDFDTGNPSVRPGRLNSAFVRHLQAGPNAIDYHLEILQSREDYDWITLKSLMAGPGEAAFLDTDWPLARLYVWPLPQAGIYEIHISIHAQLPYQFATPATVFDLPLEYYNAMMLNLAVRLRPKYRLGSYPGDPLPGMAKDSLSVVRTPNAQIAKLRMPNTLRRRGQYNIYSDRPY
jgi:hypothetical protein